jgi:hypothetical protein
MRRNCESASKLGPEGEVEVRPWFPIAGRDAGCYQNFAGLFHHELGREVPAPAAASRDGEGDHALLLLDLHGEVIRVLADVLRRDFHDLDQGRSRPRGAARERRRQETGEQTRAQAAGHRKTLDGLADLLLEATRLPRVTLDQISGSRRNGAIAWRWDDASSSLSGRPECRRA